MAPAFQTSVAIVASLLVLAVAIGLFSLSMVAVGVGVAAGLVAFLLRRSFQTNLAEAPFRAYSWSFFPGGVVVLLAWSYAHANQQDSDGSAWPMILQYCAAYILVRSATSILAGSKRQDDKRA